MRVLREQDFEKMASRAVEEFLSGKSPLASAVAKEASEAGMNPDQIDRLVQSANTMTFLRMMDQRKQAGMPDLTHEFDPVDARHVIHIVIDQAGVHVEPMDDASGRMQDPSMMNSQHELPDEAGGLSPMPWMNPAEGMPGHTDTPEVEQCEEECHDEHDPPGMMTQKAEGPPAPPKKGPPETNKKENKKETKPSDEPEEKEPPVSPKKAAGWREGRRKLASILEDQFRQAEWSFEDGFERLCARFRLAHGAPKLVEFEKDALAEHGDAFGVGVVNLLRARHGLAPLDAQDALTKVAAQADRHLSIDTPELQIFGDLVTLTREADRLRRGVNLVRQQCA